MSDHLSRRRFLKGLGLSAAGLILAACSQNQPAGAPSPTTAASAGGTTPPPPTKATTGPGATPISTPVPTQAAGATPAPAGTPTTVGAGAAPGQPYQAHTNVQGSITFWHFWSSPVRRNAIRRIVNSFMALYPSVKVTEQAIPFGDIWTKNNAAVAAGSGMPDVIVEDRPQLRVRAKNNIEQNLGDLAKRDGVTGDPFWPFTWTEAVYQGNPYGLPYETDIRVLYYNKAAFKDVGLDPNTPPANWDELWASADKLDKKSADGKLERVTFWPTYGNIGLDTWAWNNGGEWETSDNKFTINAKPNVEALEWMKKWVDRYGLANWNAFQSTFGQGNQDGFMTGRVVQKVDIAGYTSFLNFYNPQFQTADKQNLGYGVAAIPPAPGHKPASFSGGFALSIPRGIKTLDASWEFIKYAVFVGQLSWARDTYSIPTVMSIAKDPSLMGDPNWKFFVDAMSYGRPGVFNPCYPGWGEVLGPAQDAVFSGKMTAQQALDQAQQKAEEEAKRNGC